jgi:2-dehydro-3-deoxyphosphogluconate aldolase/(4S)-4-hydroxy-2-oxoglutarate aldolase
LKAICAPYRQVRFIPTGGIDQKNLGQYLALTEVIACGGSWMVRPELMNAGEFDRIRQLVKEAVALVDELRK